MRYITILTLIILNLLKATDLLIPSAYAGSKANLSIDYTHIDQIMDDIPPAQEADIASLAAYIDENAETDLDKARAIWDWITANIEYDIDAYFSGRIGSQSAENTFRTKKSVCAGYAALFKELGQRIGLPVEIVSGYSKGIGYISGGKMKVDHDWNIVTIESQKYLLDATWGAGSIGSDNKWLKKHDEFYFLTPPEQFVYSHLPEKTVNQLLEPPITLSNFVSFVNAKSTFFNSGLQLATTGFVNLISDSTLQISFVNPRKVPLLGALTDRNGNKYDSHILQKNRNDSAFFIIYLPSKGNFIFTLFSGYDNQIGRYTDAVSYNIESRYGCQSFTGFPVFYTIYSKESFDLIWPLSKILPVGSAQYFKIKAPAAQKVSLLINGNWHELNRTEDDFFEGSAIIETGKIVILAKLKNKSGDDFDYVVEFFGE